MDIGLCFVASFTATFRMPPLTRPQANRKGLHGEKLKMVSSLLYSCLASDLFYFSAGYPGRRSTHRCLSVNRTHPYTFAYFLMAQFIPPSGVMISDMHWWRCGLYCLASLSFCIMPYRQQPIFQPLFSLNRNADQNQPTSDCTLFV